MLLFTIILSVSLLPGDILNYLCKIRVIVIMMVDGHVEGSTRHSLLLLLNRHYHSGRDRMHTDPPTTASLIAWSLKSRALLERVVTSAFPHHR